MLDDPNAETGPLSDLTVGPDSIVIKRRRQARQLLLPIGILIVWALLFLIIAGRIWRLDSPALRVLLYVFAGFYAVFVLIFAVICIADAKTVITLDGEGVCRKGLFVTKRLAWSEVRYWGLIGIYNRRMMFQKKNYYLHFTKKRPPQMSHKDVYGFGMIVFRTNPDDWAVYREKVVPFCASHTDSGPDLREIDDWRMFRYI